MPDSLTQSEPLRFVTETEMQVETLPWGPHDWLCRPGLTDAHDLLLVRVHMPAGQGHKFHVHPEMEEIIYVLSGRAEQWVDREKKTADSRTDRAHSQGRRARNLQRRFRRARVSGHPFACEDFRPGAHRRERAGALAAAHEADASRRLGVSCNRTQCRRTATLTIVELKASFCHRWNLTR